MTRSDRRHGLIGGAVAAAGSAIAAYLTLVKVAGGLPACGPLHGCETVATSAYSEVFGIPLAAFGFALSGVVAVLQFVWWRTGDRRPLLVAYGLGLAGAVVVAYLSYLELFVIGAVCAWCVAYALTIVLGWLIAALAVRDG